MHMSADEFWKSTPRYFYGLMGEYVKQRSGKANPKRVYEYLDDAPGAAMLRG
jgi:Asp-tRNA(Asn)/Glu-tRNA(Gln) amidotransferase B subunit